MTKSMCSCQCSGLTTKTGVGFRVWSAGFSSPLCVTFPRLCTKRAMIFPSQVNFPFRGVDGGGGGRELRGDAEGHLLQGAVLTGVVTAVGIGTARRWEARPVLLSTQPGAPVCQASQASPLLVRHEGGEFRGVPGFAYWGGMARHPAGIWVAQLAALVCAVSRHCHVRDGTDVCGRERHKQFHQRAPYWSELDLKKRHFWTEIVSSQAPPPPPRMSLQLLLSSRQQLLCSSCYAVCNEHNHVCHHKLMCCIQEMACCVCVV